MLGSPTGGLSDVAPPRVLIVDDNPAIHQDFDKIFARREIDDELGDLEASLFETTAAPSPTARIYDVDHAHQGEEALAMAERAGAEGRPYQIAFVDVRMPPGIDGVRTIHGLWQMDPGIEAVLCSAFSDYSWQEILAELGVSDRLLVLRKPFEIIEVEQTALALSEKWSLRRKAAATVQDLETLVANRTAELERRTQERLQLEAELRHAHKLEAIGQLAAGVAHEINTPIQFIGDGLHFFREAFDGLVDFATAADRAVLAGTGAPIPPQLLAELCELREVADLDFVKEELPAAMDRTVNGVERVTSIVKAMRGFSWDQGGGMAPADINQGIRDTATVARSEYKTVADLEMELGELPLVHCALGDLNQVFLNMLINAAHAIQERFADGMERGSIRVSTRVDGSDVEICFKDNGMGIPPAVKNRIYDPFFTTKPVGRGTGQGLAISRSIVVDKHGGKLECDSALGQGTQFTIRLPAGATAGGD